MRFPVVLFDFDGTIVDSGGIILASMRHATRTVLARDYSDFELMANVGGPGLEAQMVAFAPEQADELVRVYREHNESIHDELEACPGMEGVLETLRGQDRRLGIVTAKRHKTVQLAFEHLPLAHYFDTIVAGDDTRVHKPHPDPLLLALERLAAIPGEAAYVGDSPYDMQAAKAAGVRAIGVTWGKIHDRAALRDADVIVETTEELLAEL
ncbi:MAG TPA: HAD-IA family hydrolase [Gaiellaceae bacterium]|nr:HAD-IA family hydrolase [Gaiellaceae bacterium]